MKDDRIYLLHVRDAIRQIMEYTATGKESFLADRKTQDAVVRNLEIIGEATKRRFLVAPIKTGNVRSVARNDVDYCGGSSVLRSSFNFS